MGKETLIQNINVRATGGLLSVREKKTGISIWTASKVGLIRRMSYPLDENMRA